MQQIDSGIGTTSERSETAPVRHNKPLRLPAELSVDGIAALKAQLDEVIDEPKKVVLDASEVERIHTAALQLFCLFCRDRRAAEREVEFARPSPALRAAASLLGASTLLQISRSAQ
jgi:ABC-type transporter Mla MlaB component